MCFYVVNYLFYIHPLALVRRPSASQICRLSPLSATCRHTVPCWQGTRSTDTSFLSTAGRSKLCAPATVHPPPTISCLVYKFNFNYSLIPSFVALSLSLSSPATLFPCIFIVLVFISTMFLCKLSYIALSDQIINTLHISCLLRLLVGLSQCFILSAARFFIRLILLKWTLLNWVQVAQHTLWKLNKSCVYLGTRLRVALNTNRFLNSWETISFRKSNALLRTVTSFMDFFSFTLSLSWSIILYFSYYFLLPFHTQFFIPFSLWNVSAVFPSVIIFILFYCFFRFITLPLSFLFFDAFSLFVQIPLSFLHVCKTLKYPQRTSEGC